MKISRIGIVSVFIILLSVSCRSGEDMSAYFDEGRIENNTYISDSTGWKMMIPEGWKPALKVKSEVENKAKEIYGNIGVSVSPLIWLLSIEKDKFNVFRFFYKVAISANNDDLKDMVTIEHKLLPEMLLPPIEIITIRPITKEIIDSIEFLTYSYECFLPPPINKKLYGISYMGLVRNKYVGVSINYTNLENRKEIMDAWFNSTFDKSKWKSIR